MNHNNKENKWEEKEWLKNLAFVVGRTDDQDFWKLLLVLIEDKVRQREALAIATEQQRIVDILQKNCLDYCQEQNGLPYCKNCGLSLDLITQNKEEPCTHEYAPDVEPHKCIKCQQHDGYSRHCGREYCKCAE